MLRALCGLRLVDADTTGAKGGPFYCPECREEVSLKCGSIVRPYFAHARESACGFSTGESLDHLGIKLAIYKTLSARSDVSMVELEHPLESARADVYAVIRGHGVAIEVQRSYLTEEQASHRTRKYDALGVAVLWVMLSNVQWDDDDPHGSAVDPLSARYKPNRLEKWAQRTYGCVYYWISGDTLRAVRFSPHQMLERSHRYESYWTNLLRFREPPGGVYVSIGDDFAPQPSVEAA